LSRLGSALLLDFLDLVDQIVSLLEKLGTLIGAVHGVRLAAIEKIELSHGVVVIGA
jgi:hypothetical protein